MAEQETVVPLSLNFRSIGTMRPLNSIVSI
jgi:hypothetical protein